MDPITIIGVLTAFAATVAVVYVVYLKWDDILNWFKGIHKWLKGIHKVSLPLKDQIWVDIGERLKNGDYKVIQCVINSRTEELVKGRVIQAKKIDKRLEDAHREAKIVVWD